MADQDYNYRKILYKKYFTTQVKQNEQANLHTQLHNEFGQLQADISPWLPTDKNSRILDIGCGYGNLLLWLQKNAYQHLEGIDLSPEQVETAQKLGLLQVQQADAFAYLQQQAPDKQYDRIFMFDVIEHLNKSELLQLLQLIRSKLSEQGLAILRTPNMDAPFTSIYAFGDYTHETLLNSRAATQIMRSAGFETVIVAESPLIVQGFLKKIMQKISFALLSLVVKITIFATARSSKGVLLTPNMIIVGKK